MVGDLWVQTHIATTFQYDILCELIPITRKLQVVYGRSIYGMTTLLSVMSIFCVRAGCKIQMVSYGFKHTSQSFFDKLFVHILTRITWKLGVINGHQTYQMTAILSKIFLCGLELHERSNWRATALDTHQAFSDTTVYEYTASPYIHCYLVDNFAWQ